MGHPMIASPIKPMCSFMLALHPPSPVPLLRSSAFSIALALSGPKGYGMSQAIIQPSPKQAGNVRIQAPTML